MKTLKISLILFGTLSLLLGLIYPFLFTGIAHIIFPDKADGSLIIKDGRIIGSELIGQNFTNAIYFQGRPSAVQYDATGSGAYNFGPTEKKLRQQILERISKIRKFNTLSSNEIIPADMVFSSASGLDPDISVQSAKIQILRIARARKIKESELEALIEKQTENPVFGPKRINVLKLNIELDALNRK